MIVYNLACEHKHPFEGWFASPADFENQRDRGLVECPVCGSQRIERQLHAPRVNFGGVGGRRERESDIAKHELQVAAASDSNGEFVASDDYRKLVAAVQSFTEQVRENTEYVGEKFADEARAMHYGDKPHRGIRGRTDPETAQKLRDEGIEFQSLPFPIDFPKSH
ncbi:MAG: DUF1178 family protein [Burkholderiales bacterium]|nr:MAG: DUF1178 family protein [Burkholderiales bacterium]TAG77891.1 MAG: DUF1178 family protein [Betaproteobacteria bacterium]